MSEPPSPPPHGLDSEALLRLLEISRRIHIEANADAVLEVIVDSLIRLTKADRGFLVLRGEGGELEFRVARDKAGHPLEEKRFRLSLGVVNDVASRGETRLIDDAANADAWQSRRSVISLSLRTILCTPLVTSRGVIGVIYVDSNAITRRFTPVDVVLVEAFAAQAAAAIERVRLQQAELDRDRMRRQLEIASEIQKTFLPEAFPEVDGLRGSATALPAQQVGGDFYDVTRLPGGRVGVMVGDVSGKGVPGALFGARLLSDVRYEALYQEDVGHALTAVNRIVADRATRGMFVTFCYVVIDPASGEVEYGNAGHLAPIVRRPDGSLSVWHLPLGLPLGVHAGATYEAGHARLERGETLLLLSDGLQDAVGPDGERFGEARLEAAISAGPADPGVLVSSLIATVAAFTGPRPQGDDQTLLAVALA